MYLRIMNDYTRLRINIAILFRPPRVYKIHISERMHQMETSDFKHITCLNNSTTCNQYSVQCFNLARTVLKISIGDRREPFRRTFAATACAKSLIYQRRRQVTTGMAAVALVSANADLYQIKHILLCFYETSRLVLWKNHYYFYGKW